MLLLGFYIDYAEVDNKPTPRALWNLGQAHMRDAELNEAYHYWWLCANYNHVYGTDIKARTDQASMKYVGSIFKARRQVRLLNKMFNKGGNNE